MLVYVFQEEEGSMLECDVRLAARKAFCSVAILMTAFSVNGVCS